MNINKRDYSFTALLLLYAFSYNLQATHLADEQHTMSITVIGTGYVGLVTGAGLAECGNIVTCADIDKQKIAMLQQGVIPIYEPELDQVVKQNVEQNRLSFTSNVTDAVRQADIIFIAVGTPMGDDGSADLTALFAVVKTISKNCNKHKIIVTKSTVPIGTGKIIEATLKDTNVNPNCFDIVSNPEFLREGSAVKDFLEPDRIIIGTDSQRAFSAMRSVYQPLISAGSICMLTDVVTAETIKYASNAFLATKLSYINEIANLCNQTGADVQIVSYAMGLDKRISPYFLKPGPGFGGSCFPKDTQALLYTARQYGIELRTIAAAIQTNEFQKQLPYYKLLKLMDIQDSSANPLTGKTIAILGLAFKADTDDIRYSPATSTINLLLHNGATIKAYDPIAIDNMKKEFPMITYCSSPYEAMKDADAIIIMTEWNEFKEIDPKKMRQLVHNPLIIDTRKILDKDRLVEHGFVYDTI